MSLSGISFSSYQNSIASAYPTQRTAKVTPIREVARAADTSGTAVAAGLGTLLKNLAAQDAPASRTALQGLVNALGRAEDGSGQFTRLLGRVAASLESGETAPALGLIQGFLLASGRVTGTSFSARG